MDMHDLCDYCGEGPYHLYRVRAIDGSDEWLCFECREDLEFAARPGQVIVK